MSRIPTAKDADVQAGFSNPETHSYAHELRVCLHQTHKRPKETERLRTSG